ASAGTRTLCVPRNSDTQSGWSRLLYQRSPMPDAPAKLVAAYVCIPLRMVMSTNRGLENYGVPDGASERAALERLAACPTQPSLILHEGARLTAFWLLREPAPCGVSAPEEGRPGRPREPREGETIYRVLWNLAVMLDGDRGAINPRTETFGIPS